jgi:Phage capsid protein
VSTSIPNAFIKQYESDVHDIFQREGGYLRPTVRMKTGIVGMSTTFQKVGKGIATTKARHGVVTPMNIDHTPILCTLEDFYAPDWVDKLDEAKTNIDERGAIARAGAWAIGRKVDEQIFTALDSTSEATVTITVTNRATIRASMAAFVEAAWDNDVPNDGQVFGALTPRAWSQVMLLDEFSNSQWVGANSLPWTTGMPTGGKFKDWNGVKWMMHTGLPGKGTATAANFIWHKMGIGYATGAHANNNAENDAVRADIWWSGERQAHLITHSMSGGAALIDTTGVIQATIDDTAAISVATAP